MAKHVLMIVGDFVEDYEAAVPVWVLESHGIVTEVVSPGRKRGERVVTAVHDFEGEQTYCERRGHGFGLTSDWPEDALVYDGLVLPGGRSPEFLQLDDRVLRVCRSFMQGGRPVAALCHGLQILAAADVLRGRRVTGYPGVKPQVVASGAQWAETGAGMDRVHVDENLVTGPAWPALGAWMKAFVGLLARSGRDEFRTTSE